MDICTFLKKLCCKEPECPAEEANLSNTQQSTLMPATIDENEPQYLPVKEIGEKLRTDRQIRNIALTGPYGSGKSSVLCTLQTKYPEFNYLQISLATLEAYDSAKEQEEQPNKEQVQQGNSVNSDTDKAQDKKRDVEKQNRLIEYSILQQLIYREKYERLRIPAKTNLSFEKKKLCHWTLRDFLLFHRGAYCVRASLVTGRCNVPDIRLGANCQYDIRRYICCIYAYMHIHLYSESTSIILRLSFE